MSCAVTCLWCVHQLATCLLSCCCCAAWHKHSAGPRHPTFCSSSTPCPETASCTGSSAQTSQASSNTTGQPQQPQDLICIHAVMVSCSCDHSSTSLQLLLLCCALIEAVLHLCHTIALVMHCKLADGKGMQQLKRSAAVV